MTPTKILDKEIEEKILKEVAKGFPRSKGLGKYGLYLYEELKLREAIFLTQQKAQEIFEKKIKELKEKAVSPYKALRIQESLKGKKLRLTCWVDTDEIDKLAGGKLIQ